MHRFSFLFLKSRSQFTHGKKLFPDHFPFTGNLDGDAYTIVVNKTEVNVAGVPFGHV